MGLSVCPLAIVAAPVEVVWANFTEWERYSEWAHARVKRAEPEGPAAAGQTVHFTGMGLGFTFKVEAFGPSSHQLDVHEAGPRKVLESRAEGYVLGRARRSTRRVLLRPIKAI